MTSANLFDLLLHLAVFTSVVSANFASSTAPINSAMQEPEGLFGTLFQMNLSELAYPFMTLSRECRSSFQQLQHAQC